MDHRVVETIRQGQAAMQDQILADLVVERGLLSQAQTAAYTAQTPPGSLADRLVEEGCVSRQQMEQLSEEMDLLESLDTVVEDVTPARVREAARDPASRVGKYVLVEKLGAGGMGQVWKAWDYGLGRWVALKFLKVHDSKLIRRFLREATLLARLAHPNITQVFEVGIQDGRPFLAMELVDGGALGGEPMDRREAAEVVRDAAQGVAYAHKQGIVHRDLKPPNLLRSSEGRVFVTDFGLATMREEQGGLTVSGAVLGTPSYMAPEQAQGRDADERTDVYGLGATLFGLVEGRPPFEGEIAAEIVRRVATSQAPPLSGDRDDLTVVARKAMERDRRDRYQTAQELADDLQRYLEDEPVLAQPISTLRGAWRRARRRPVYSSAVAAGVALLLVLGTWAGDRLNDVRLRSRADRILGEVAPLETEYRRFVDAGALESSAARSVLEAMRPGIEQAAEVAPEYGRSLYYRGRLLNWTERFGEAEEVFSRILAEDPDNHEARVARGKNRLSLAAEVDDWEPDPTLTTSMSKGMEFVRDPPTPAARSWISAAGEDFEALPDDSEEKARGLGAVAYYEGDYETCVRFLEPFVAERDYQNEARRVLLWCLLGTGRFEAAEEHAQYLLAQGIFPTLAMEMRAYARAGQQRFEEAVADLQWLRQTNPEYDSHFIPFWMALAGRAEEAEKEYDRRLAEAPDSVQLLLDRSALHWQMGDREKALADAERALALDPDNPEGHHRRAIALEIGPEALAAYDRAVDLAPERPFYRGMRAMTRFQLGDLEGAIADAAFAAEREPDYVNWRLTLAIAHLESQHWAEAEESFVQAIRMGAEDGLTRSWLGITRIQQGKCQAGIRDFLEAEALGEEINAQDWELVREHCEAELVERLRAEAGRAS